MTTRKKIIFHTWLIGLLIIFMLFIPMESKAATNIHQTGMKEEAVTIAWNRVNGEATYDIYIYMPISSYWKGGVLYTNYSLQLSGSTNQNTYTFSNLEGGNQYKIFIYSYNSNDEEMYSTEYIIETLPRKAEIYRTSLKWGSYYSYGQNKTMTYNLYTDILAQDSADGYEICLYNSKGKKVKTIKISAKNGATIRQTFYSLKDNAYRVKVRAYKKVNGKTCYGKWSDKEYVLRQPKCMARWYKNKLDIKWEPIKGVTGYDVYLCDIKKGTYKKVKSVSSKTSMVSIKKYKSKKFKNGKKYYYYVVAKKKIGGKTYESALSYRFKVIIGK